MSLYRMGGITNKKSFVGFSNFVKLMDDKNFLEAMQNSILIIVMVMICTIVLAVLFAALLSRGNFKGKNFFRIIFYIPNILVLLLLQVFSVQSTIRVQDCSIHFWMRFI